MEAIRKLSQGIVAENRDACVGRGRHSACQPEPELDWKLRELLAVVRGAAGGLNPRGFDMDAGSGSLLLPDLLVMSE